jgi:hypothetical protein
MSVNRLFYDQRGLRFGHNFIYDFETLRLLLDAAGFVEIEQHGFGSGRDPVLVVDDELRRVESLYVEAVRPPEEK